MNAFEVNCVRFDAQGKIVCIVVIKASTQHVDRHAGMLFNSIIYL